MEQLSTQEKFKRGAADAGRFFWYMAEFVGFTEEDAAAIRETRFIIEKYIPNIVSQFYTQLLRFPATRRQFTRRDGTIDQPGLQLRMQHQATFWRRAASGIYDEDFARFVDYVGRAHTSNGADPKIYIAERYVIGMVGFVQQRVTEALTAELAELDPDLEKRAVKAWNALLMVILELLSRAYGHAREEETFDPQTPIDPEAVHQLAVETYERSLGMAREIQHKEVCVGPADEIPNGSRTIVQVDDLSIGVFHHKGEWYALHNSCLHRGGPVCAGDLTGNTITCPWHGYTYDLPSGKLDLDSDAKLPMYRVEIRNGQVYLHIPILVRDELDISLDEEIETAAEEAKLELAPNEFMTAALQPGEILLVEVAGEPVAVSNVEGDFYATHDTCTHVGGPLHEGHLKGYDIVCPWHDSCFDVRDGRATCGPAKEAVKTYRVEVDGEIGRVLEYQG